MRFIIGDYARHRTLGLVLFQGRVPLVGDWCEVVVLADWWWSPKRGGYVRRDDHRLHVHERDLSLHTHTNARIL